MSLIANDKAYSYCFCPDMLAALDSDHSLHLISGRNAH